MAVLQTILSLFATQAAAEPEIVVPAAPTTYSVRPLTVADLEDVLRLNLRCFRDGENYTKHTVSYLLNEPRTLSYQTVSAEGQMVGFIFVMVNTEGIAHITTVGVAPEVRVGNTAAQMLYNQHGYVVTQKIAAYYNNGEDGYLMMKSIV